MKKIKITVLATTFNAEIAKEYAAEGLTPCTYNTVGQILDGAIVAEFQRGYMARNKVIRPSMVQVVRNA